MAQEAGPDQITDWTTAIFGTGTGTGRAGTTGNHWGSGFTGQPAAAARGADRIDVLAFGADGGLRHRWWDRTHWVDWEIVTDALAGDALTCSWSGDRLDVFVATRGAALWYRTL